MIKLGDCLQVLRGFDAESIDMCMTSPPYWGLRDYGTEQIFGGDADCEHEWGEIKKTLKHKSGETNPGKESWFKDQGASDDRGNCFCHLCHAWKGQLGLEPTPEMYIEHMTEIFSEVKRVLKAEGTLWLNVGDTYSGSHGNSNPNDNTWATSSRIFKKDTLRFPANIPPKCLCMIPERLAWSLIQDGWILRNKIVWYKPNGMPSSVKDRFSNKWEYIFLFSKSRKYYFDLDAVREAHITPLHSPGNIAGKEERISGSGGEYELRTWGTPLGKNPGDVMQIEDGVLKGKLAYEINRFEDAHPEIDLGWFNDLIIEIIESKINPGDFWSINTQPFPQAHFAVFPEKLCEKPIKAGCPEQVCKKCGKARERIVNHKSNYTKREPAHAPRSEPSKVDSSGWHPPDIQQIGWTTCDCNAGYKPGTALDPFCGAGTTGVVAKKLNRNFIGIDIKQEYIDMALNRINNTQAQLGLAI